MSNVDEASLAWPKPPASLMWWLTGLVVAAGIVLLFLPSPLTPSLIKLPAAFLGSVLLLHMAGLNRKEPSMWIGLILTSYAVGLFFWALYAGKRCDICYGASFVFFLGERLLSVPTLALLGMRRQPKVAMVYWLALLVITMTVILVSLNPSTSLSRPLIWCMTNLLVLGLAMPHLEGVLHGEAPSARLFWILGWQMRWMAAVLAIFAKNDVVSRNTVIPSIPYEAIYLLADLFLILGFYAECRRWDMGLWPYVLGTGTLL